MTRVAVVRGGASGIGEATARLLAKRGVAASFVNGAVITVDGGMTAQGR